MFKINISNYIRINVGFRRSAHASIVFLCIMTLMILCPIYLVQKKVEAATGTAKDSTLTLTFANNRNTASVSLSLSVLADTFATSGDSEKATFNVTTNNITGYTLNLKMSGATNALSNDSGSISSINGVTTANNFAVNTWGLLPSKYNSVANTTNYYPASSAGFNIDTTNAANNVGNEYKIGLGIKANYTTKAGAYSNNAIVLEYVANPVTYSISYDKGNVPGTPSGIPSSQSGSLSSTSITLSSTVPSLTGYDFKGWCLGTVNTPSNENDTCSGTIFNPNGSGTNLVYGIDKTTINIATLHAMWNRKNVNVTVAFAGVGVTDVVFSNSSYGNVVVSSNNGVASIKYGIQYNISGRYSSNNRFSSWYNTGGTIGSISSATTTYSTTANANLMIIGSYPYLNEVTYMQNNINCSGSTTGSPTTLKDSRDNSTYTITKIGDNCIMTKNLAITGTIPAEGSNFTGSDLVPDYTGYSSLKLANVSAKVQVPDSNYGAYYNFCMATAGDVCSYSYSGSFSENVSDICPTGWRIPTKKQWNAIINSPNAVALFNAQIGGGYMASSSSTPLNSNLAEYWSTTSFSSIYGYVPYVIKANSSEIWLSDGGNLRYYGQTIRCIYKGANGGGVLPIKINFAGVGVSNVKVCKTSGNCSGSDLMGTVSSSGGMISGLEYGTNYYLYPTFNNGYGLYSWARNGSYGEISSTSAQNPTITIGAGLNEITITGIENQKIKINFAGAGVSNVKVCKTSGNCSGSDLMGTVSSSGGTVSNLTYNTPYYLYPTFNSGYGFYSWANNGSYGSLSSTTSSNPYFTIGAGTGEVTITGIVNQSLKVNFAGAGVSNVKVCKTSGNCSGSDLMGTVSSSGGTVSNLTYNNAYYLYPTFASGYSLKSWANNGSYGSLSSTTSSNPYFTIGAGTGEVTITGIANQSLRVYFAGSGVTSVKVCKTSGDCSSSNLMGTISSSGGTVSGLVYNTTYYLYPTFTSGYSLKSWANNGSYGSLSSTTTNNPSFTIGAGSSEVTVTGIANQSLRVYFAGSGVTSVKVCKTSGDCSGSNLMGTISSSGGTVSGLVYNTAYYLYPSFSSGYKLSSWTNNGSYGSLSSTASSNPRFTIGTGTGDVTVTGVAGS